MRRILIVDENKYLRDGLTLQLRATVRNCLVITAENGIKAMEVLEAGPVDLLLTDLRMAGMDGYELMERAVRCFPLVPMYAMTSENCASVERRARSLGARQCLSKPLSFETIAQFITHELNVVDKEAQAY
jgi:CheY-like chemotaxis protein